MCLYLVLCKDCSRKKEKFNLFHDFGYSNNFFSDVYYVQDLGNKLDTIAAVGSVFQLSFLLGLGLYPPTEGKNTVFVISEPWDYRFDR